MKKRIILIIVFMVLVAGFLLVSETVSAKAAAFSLSAGANGGWSPTDPLMPTGDSTTDTANLQAAIHDSRMDAGGTLYLGPGTFLVHASLS